TDRRLFAGWFGRAARGGSTAGVGPLRPGGHGSEIGAAHARHLYILIGHTRIWITLATGAQPQTSARRAARRTAGWRRWRPTPAPQPGGGTGARAASGHIPRCSRR